MIFRIARMALNLLALSIVAALLSGCGGAVGPENVYIADENDNGQTVTMGAGDALQISLPENRSTGYVWSIVTNDEAVLRPTDEPTYAIEGEPLPGAWIRVEAWRGLEGLLDWQAFADASGEAVWEDAPAEGISLAAEAAGAAPGSVKIPRLKDETYTIRIAAAVRIHGRVLKENDGAPVAAFAVTPGMAARNADGIRWLSSRRFEGADGAFSFTVPRDDEVENFVKITAPGHAPWISPQISSERDEVELTARLAAGCARHLQSGGQRELDDGEADAAGCAVYQDPLPRRRPGALEQGTIGGRVRGPQSGPLGVRERVGERPHVLLAAQGVLGIRTAQRAGDVDALAGVRAHAGPVGAGRVGEGGQIAVGARPHVRLERVHPGGLDPYQDLARDRCRLGQLFEPQDLRLAELVDDDGAHHGTT